ncbi:MAG: CDP-archaeol synthase [Parachlamydiaceae bacterium]|nr:CDP-archaeol synthase [Parachlamydiaceae bacterium]
MISTQFKQRLLSSSLGFFIIAISIYFSFNPLFQPVFVLLNALLISLALREYYHLVEHKGFQPLSFIAILFSIIYIFATAFSLHIPYYDALPSLVLLLSFIVFFLILFYRSTPPIVNLAVTVFGMIYLTIPLSCILKINYFFPSGTQDGRLWLAYVLTISKITDVGAYFIGKWKGHHLLAPFISPKKTIAGSLGGIIFALVISLGFALLSQFTEMKHIFHLTIWQSLWLGFLISVLSQAGDLSESLLKRDAGIKNSSRLPGLGGILDTVDSLVFTLPLMYLLLRMSLFD